MSTMVTEGGCLCGSVRYRLVGSPESSIICHCVTCRRASSAPSVGWLTYKFDHYSLVAGSLGSYESSTGVTRTFCRVCGSPMTYRSSDSGDTIDITSGSLDDPCKFPPTREVWLEHRIAWQPRNQELEQYPKGTGSGPYA